MAGFPNNNQNRRKRIYDAHKVGVVTSMWEDNLENLKIQEF